MAAKKGKIITHPGSAHFDDIFATSLVIYKCSIDKNYPEIEVVHRKKPNKKELEDPSIWKLDIGGKFNPKLKQFDHHPPVDPTEGVAKDQRQLLDECAFSLLLKDWGVWEKAKELYDWLEPSRIMDIRGPKGLVDEYEISYRAINSLESFIEQSVLTMFEKQDKIEPSEPLFNLLHFIGKHFFESILNYYETLELVKEHALFKTIKGVPVIHYPNTAKRTDMLTRVLKDKKDEKWGIGGIGIYPNTRPEGSIAAMRYEDDERVDFTRIADYDHVIFTHPNGFIVALDSEISDQELERYIQNAID